jgi:hypothetical protein
VGDPFNGVKNGNKIGNQSSFALKNAKKNPKKIVSYNPKTQPVETKLKNIRLKKLFESIYRYYLIKRIFLFGRFPLRTDKLFA